MSVVSVGVGEYKISTDVGDVIKTYALGSCVAVIIYDKIRKIAGMLHVALPDSKVDLNKSLSSPGHFADTGLPVLIEEMKKNGAIGRDSWIKIAGGAKIMDPNSLFDIGKRNIIAIKKILWSRNLGPIAEDVGGDYCRTVGISVETGEVQISSGKRTWNL
ncbi:MAG: chemotaxis protein CheD [Spirochaetes bacterium]|nr:chemotaxis protein CheD [Spirochaetota bacterium]